MKFVISSLLICVFSLPSLVFSQSDLKKRVRVRLQSQLDQVFISGTGLRIQGMSYSFKAVAIPQNESIRIQRVKQAGRSFWQIQSSLRPHAQILSNEFLLIEGRHLKNNAQTLPSQVLLTAGSAQKIDVVGVLPLEEYLIGVLASEMPLSWPLETLKAQAIAARSYATVVMSERSKKPYHLESSVLDQVFKHVLLEDDRDPLISKAALAVKATRGMQLVTPKGQTLKAFYHSDCGGKTASSRNVWNSGVSTGEAVDDSCPTNPKASWVTKLDKVELFAKIKKFLRNANNKTKNDRDIQGLEFVRIPGDERIKEVKVSFNDASLQVINGNEFRSIVGFQELKSMVFSVSETSSGGSDEFVLRGRGFGHGVGLCQWGSRAMGLQGKGYQEILKHYYPLARIDDSLRN